MLPTVELYYDTRLSEPPEVQKWLQDFGISSIVRSPTEAPAEWQRRYGCCLPWVVVDGRIQLKGGFQKVHLERLVHRWRGRSLVGVGVTSEQFGTQRSIIEATTRTNAFPYQIQLWDLGPAQAAIGAPQTNRERRVGADNFDCRLANYFSAAFRRGYQPVVACFSPVANQLPIPAAIQEVLELLRNYDVVYSRDAEGNWKYLALRAWLGALFIEDGQGWRLDLKTLCETDQSNQLQVKRLDKELLATSAAS